MGGDNAPQEIVAGLSLFLERVPNTSFLLFGEEKLLSPLVKSFPNLNQNNIQIIHCPDTVLPEDKASFALRRRKESSMTKAIEAVHLKKAHGIISSGNTGALMAISLFMLGTNANIHRPAIIAPVPTISGESCMLDMGANTVCTVQNLVQFAILGQAYARTSLNIKRPRVSLLNIGSEAIKGRTEIQEAAQILEKCDLPFQWNGFLEANLIPLGETDVIVTDGFTGNISIKTGEGIMKMLTGSLRESFNASLFGKLGYLMAQRQIKRLSLRMDPRRYNGAVLIGLNGLVIKSHGNSDRLAFANALGSCARMISAQFMETVERDLADITRIIPS
jgi:glycerol-3-phosphate acyltransferase PlsX